MLRADGRLVLLPLQEHPASGSPPSVPGTTQLSEKDLASANPITGQPSILTTALLTYPDNVIFVVDIFVYFPDCDRRQTVHEMIRLVVMRADHECSRLVDIAPLPIEANGTNPFGEFSHFFKSAFYRKYAILGDEAPVFACLYSRQPIAEDTRYGILHRDCETAGFIDVTPLPIDFYRSESFAIAIGIVI
jgi:hypothetical protein